MVKSEAWYRAQTKYMGRWRRTKIGWATQRVASLRGMARRHGHAGPSFGRDELIAHLDAWSGQCAVCGRDDI